jgi:hypothetical protein
MQTSSVLQQSYNQIQRSFYSDPQCKIILSWIGEIMKW